MVGMILQWSIIVREVSSRHKQLFLGYIWDLSFKWVLVSSMKYFTHAGHDYAQEGVGDVESSCSSPPETEEYSLEITDNYPLDDEVGKRLSQMIPIPVCSHLLT